MGEDGTLADKFITTFPTPPPHPPELEALRYEAECRGGFQKVIKSEKPGTNELTWLSGQRFWLLMIDLFCQ